MAKTPQRRRRGTGTVRANARLRANKAPLKRSGGPGSRSVTWRGGGRVAAAAEGKTLRQPGGTQPRASRLLRSGKPVNPYTPSPTLNKIGPGGENPTQSSSYRAKKGKARPLVQRSSYQAKKGKKRPLRKA